MDKQISSTTKYVLIIGLIVALVTAAAIFIGARPTKDTTKEDNTMSEIEKPEAEATEDKKTGTVKLSIERLASADFIKLSEQDPNNPIPVTAYGSYVTDGAVTWHSAGSSSCPPIITSATYDYDTNTVNMTQADYSGKMCTMDLHPLQQRIFIEGGEKIPDDATLNVSK